MLDALLPALDAIENWPRRCGRCGRRDGHAGDYPDAGAERPCQLSGSAQHRTPGSRRDLGLPAAPRRRGCVALRMIGVVIVSHSARLAEGVVELAQQVAQDKVRVAAAGGTADAANPIGTDAFRVLAAIEAVDSGDGVLVLMDLGSAVLSAETALELLDETRRSRVRLCAGPLVEGAVAAVSLAAAGGTLDEIAAEAEQALGAKTTSARRAAEERVVTLPNRLGLHARPAARLIRLVRRFDARVTLENLTAQRRSFRCSEPERDAQPARHARDINCCCARKACRRVRYWRNWPRLSSPAAATRATAMPRRCRPWGRELEHRRASRSVRLCDSTPHRRRISAATLPPIQTPSGDVSNRHWPPRGTRPAPCTTGRVGMPEKMPPESSMRRR